MRQSAPAAPRACELASPFLANAIQTGLAGSGNPPQSPPARGRHCGPVGGYMRKEGAEQREGSKEDSIDWLRLPTAAVPASGLLAATRPTLLVLLAREPIFSETHTNEFCGIGKSIPEPAGSWAPLRPGRWVYEKGEGRAAKKGQEDSHWAGFGSRRLRCPTPLPTLRFSLAREPIFSETHTNEFCGIGKSTQEPAGSWAPLRPGRWVYEGKERKPLWGGCRVASAPLHGSLRRPLQVPFHNSPLSRGALRSAGVPTISASTTPAPLLPWRSGPGKARHLGRLRSGAREYPMCAEGWALWVLGRWPDLYLSHRGYLPVGEASGLNLPVGPPLGALRRRLRGANAPRSRPPTALWGIQEGKADVTRCKTGARRTSSAATRALAPADPVT